MKIFTNDKGEAPMVLLTEQELLIIEPFLTKAVQEFDHTSGAPAWFYPLRKLQEEVQETLSYF